MKRHESIAPLSRDHHQSLILAQLLKKNAPVYRNLPEHAADKAAYAQQQYARHIQKHFEQEEAMLSLFKNVHASIDLLAGEIIAEHRQLAALFASLDNTTELESRLDALAVALEAHIRKEERVLFPLLQQYGTEPLLQQIHELLH